jgi:hypothetical protein
MELTGKEYEYVHHPTVIGVVMELHEKKADQMITLGDLVEKFYRIHLPTDTHDERLNPIAFRLIDENRESISDKAWYGVFYGGFYVYIARAHKLHGPHVAQLWFKSFTTKLAWWVATLQLVAFYFNENEMREALMSCIERKEWYVSSNEAKKAIVP